MCTTTTTTKANKHAASPNWNVSMLLFWKGRCNSTDDVGWSCCSDGSSTSVFWKHDTSLWWLFWVNTALLTCLLAVTPINQSHDSSWFCVSAAGEWGEVRRLRQHRAQRLHGGPQGNDMSSLPVCELLQDDLRPATRERTHLGVTCLTGHTCPSQQWTVM